MTKHRFFAFILLLILVGLGYFTYASQVRTTGFVSHFPFKLGLDLAGGTQLTYSADVTKIDPADVDSSMISLRDVIERRINILHVSEPIIQVEKGGAGSVVENKLIVGLPGVTDIDKAVALIGQTPTLDFRLINGTSTTEDTGLTGRYLSRATLEFAPNTNEPIVGIQFNDEGGKLFDSITKNNVGRQLAIFLDGTAISAPTIREEISSGQAQISGRFTATQAKDLVRNLNYGALPVPISLVGTESVGASLGQKALDATTKAGVIGFVVVAIFLILYYRLPGLLASVSLVMYVILSLVVFKLIPVTLTSAGLAGFILSIGMAVDANILIFERMREEMHRGLSISDSVNEGFARAWNSIRDSNLSSIITAIVLYYFSSTAVIQGFALVFGLGVLISMFTAITVSRTFLIALGNIKTGKISRFLFGRGLTSAPVANNLK